LNFSGRCNHLPLAPRRSLFMAYRLFSSSNLQDGIFFAGHWVDLKLSAALTPEEKSATAALPGAAAKLWCAASISCKVV